ncbi:MAG: ABC transporter ATP-binding protein [Acidimicrobiaceae bacterium]|nr:ABC transporter ATP-binding protein [Acidimicrobiaceae bacterium]MYC42854.1 ABC transporter ATP-binding protein [Acidimicrobiaceae bacterium]MYH88220.1 ABC transporter ATP-binding protein [Acidimicrobiaceae bacterium]
MSSRVPLSEALIVDDHISRRGGRLIARSLRAHPGPHTVAMFGATLFVFAAVGGAWVLRGVTDELIVPAFDKSGLAETGSDRNISGNTVWLAMAALIGVSLIRGISVVTRRFFLSMAEFRTQRDWRRGLLWHYLDVPLRFHRAKPTGELLAHADIDVQMATMVLKPLAFSLSVLLLVLVSVVSIFLVHPLLALIAAILFPALVVVSQKYTSLVEEPAALAQQRVGDVSAIAHESFDGAVIVKTLGREAAEVERMLKASDRLREWRVRVGRLRANFEPVIDSLPNIGIILLILVGTWLVSRGDASEGDLVLAATLFGLLVTPLRVLGFFLEELPRSVVSLERVDRVMAHPLQDRSGTAKLPDGPLGVVVDDLTVTYSGSEAVSEMSFVVYPGETLALVGPTGSGKSTLLESIAGLLEPSGGSIRIGGVAVDELAPEELSRGVALAFQEAFLFATSISENVSMGTHGVDVDGSLRLAEADGFVAALPAGSATVVGERGQTLSGGQRQRVALARALVRSPQLLLLDDATSAVDPVVEARILDNLAQHLNTTVIVVAHRISTILLADRVAYIDAGRVLAVGRHDDLLEREDYRTLVMSYEQADLT